MFFYSKPFRENPGHGSFILVVVAKQHDIIIKIFGCSKRLCPDLVQILSRLCRDYVQILLNFLETSRKHPRNPGNFQNCPENTSKISGTPKTVQKTSPKSWKHQKMSKKHPRNPENVKNCPKNVLEIPETSKTVQKTTPKSQKHQKLSKKHHQNPGNTTKIPENTPRTH